MPNTRLKKITKNNTTERSDLPARMRSARVLRYSVNLSLIICNITTQFCHREERCEGRSDLLLIVPESASAYLW